MAYSRVWDDIQEGFGMTYRKGSGWHVRGFGMAYRRVGDGV